MVKKDALPAADMFLPTSLLRTMYGKNSLDVPLDSKKASASFAIVMTFKFKKVDSL